MRLDAKHELDGQALTEVFEGLAIVSVDEETEQLTLSNGRVLQIVPNEGCWGCPSGNYALTSLETCDNIITRAKLEVEYSMESEKSVYSIFVYAGNSKIEAVRVEGEDGNGYYGSGFELNVFPMEESLPK